MKNRFKRFITEVLISTVLVGSVIGFVPSENANAASLAKPSDAPTQQNIMEILSKYDPDVYYYMNTQINRGVDVTAWSYPGSSLIQSMDTITHEVYHTYTLYDDGTNYHYGDSSVEIESFSEYHHHYAGSGKSYELNAIYNYYYTEEIANSLPQEYRTERFDLYIGKGSDTGANTVGFVGMMNEFAAYYWGLETMHSLVPYLKDYDGQYDDWWEYVFSLGSDMIAYAEFKYWMLEYMIYASENHPETYQFILNDRDICSAYATFETRFSNLINDSINEIDTLNEYLINKDMYIYYDSVGIFLNYCGVELDDYNLLMNRLSSPTYVAMDKLIKEKAGVTATPAPTAVPTAAPTAAPTAVVTPNPTATAKPTTTDTKPVTTPTPTKAPDSAKETGVGGFVERLYTVAMGRESDPSGKAYWENEVKVNGKTGADLGLSFLLSPEFLGKKMSNDQFLEVLYKTFFDREGEAGGKKYWTDEMTSGRKTKVDVIYGFINSEEWANICLTYGIKSGTDVKPTITITPSQDIRDFAERLYTTCLNRASEAGGLNYWANELANLRKSGSDVAKGFFFSEELKKSGINDAEFLTRLYKTVMGREPEAEGFNFWLGQMQSGAMSRENVFDGFAASEEWIGICADYGILR